MKDAAQKGIAKMRTIIKEILFWLRLSNHSDSLMILQNRIKKRNNKAQQRNKIHQYIASSWLADPNPATNTVIQTSLHLINHFQVTYLVHENIHK